MGIMFKNIVFCVSFISTKFACIFSVNFFMIDFKMSFKMLFSVEFFVAKSAVEVG